jgi:hypothetical protein
MTDFLPQAYPLWCAARHDRTVPIRVGRVLAWRDGTPTVAWQSEQGEIRQVGPPETGEMWWLGDDAGTARRAAEEAYRNHCPRGHGLMARREPFRWACEHEGCGQWTAEVVTSGVAQ